MFALIILSIHILLSMGTLVDSNSGNNTVSDKFQDRADLLQVVLPIIRRFQWTSVLIITDFADANVLSIKLSRNHIFNTVIHASGGILSPPLQYFSKSRFQQRIVMWCKTSCLQEILAEENVLLHKFLWLLVYPTNVDVAKDLTMLSKYIRLDDHIFAIIPNDWLFVKLQYKKSFEDNIRLKTLATIDTNISWISNDDLIHVLKGFSFTATMFHWPPLSEVRRTDKGISIKGVRCDLMLILARYLGFKFKYEILFAKGDNDNHTFMTFWNIQRQKLRDNLVNMSGMFMPCTLGDLPTIRHSSHIFSVRSAVIINNINQVWTCIFLTIAICIVLAFISTAFCVQHVLNFRFVQYWYDWINLFVKDTLTPFPSQGLHFVQSPITSKKIFTVASLFTTLFIIISYGSVLTSHLAAENYGMPYEILEDMIEDGRFTFGTLGNSAMDFTVKNSKTGALFTMRNKSMYQTFPKLTDGYRRIFQQHFAAILPIEFTTKLNCSYAFLKTTYIPYDITLNFPKNSPYVEIFSKFIMRMRSSGITSKIVGSYTAIHRPQCEFANMISTVNLSQIVLLVFTLISGILIASSLLVLEIVIDKFTASL